MPIFGQSSKENKNTNISGLGVNFKSETGPKTGVELRYHKPPESAKLSKEQRDGLLDLRPANKFRGKSGYKGNDRGGNRNSHGNGSSKGKKAYYIRIKGQVSAAIKKQRK